MSPRDRWFVPEYAILAQLKAEARKAVDGAARVGSHRGSPVVSCVMCGTGKVERMTDGNGPPGRVTWGIDADGACDVHHRTHRSHAVQNGSGEVRDVCHATAHKT